MKRPLFKTAEEADYIQIKQAFIRYFDQAAEKCQKNYDNQYDQERYFDVVKGCHPEIEKRRVSRERSQRIVMQKLDEIESYSSFQTRTHLLKEYAQGITQRNFGCLFMVIFTGKLQKHFLSEFSLNSAVNDAVLAPRVASIN